MSSYLLNTVHICKCSEGALDYREKIHTVRILNRLLHSVGVRSRGFMGPFSSGSGAVRRVTRIAEGSSPISVMTCGLWVIWDTKGGSGAIRVSSCNKILNIECNCR